VTMLRLEKIAKRFTNGTLALEGIDLEVAPQTIVSIVGASGSGKSTLLRVIFGLEKPSSGKLSWNGLSIQRSQHKISFIFQEPRLMPWLKVSDNVRLGLGPSPDRDDEKLVTEAIAKVGLQRFAQARGSFREGWLSGWPSPEPWWLALHWYCWTNRLARSMPLTGSNCKIIY
jgi:sulfonate transport system ATP-binding protein